MNAPRRVDWNNLDLSTPERFHQFVLEIEASSRAAVAAAIADHKAAGNAIYYRSEAPPDILVKELPDGRRFRVEFSDDGVETVGAPLD